MKFIRDCVNRVFKKNFPVLLGSAFLLLTSLTLNAASIEFGGVIPGMTTLSKQVVSMREQRFLHLIRQETDFSCGAAALATVIRYAYGIKVTEQDMLEGLFAVSDSALVREQGFSLLNIKHYVQRLGMRGRGYRVEPETLEQIKIPTIVLLDLKGYKHFVVLRKTENNLVYLADPALGNKTMSKDDFLNSWNGIVFAVIGRGFDRNSVLVNPPPALTARALVNVFAPLSDAQLLDHGFIHSELF